VTVACRLGIQNMSMCLFPSSFDANSSALICNSNVLTCEAHGNIVLIKVPLDRIGAGKIAISDTFDSHLIV